MVTSQASMSLDQLCINAIRTLSIDAIEKANSGHPGLPLGAAPMAYALWQRHLAHDPAVPDWPDRDRFVLSAGHGSMLLYSLLHLTGYDLPLEELKAFRQWGSKTPGHPEFGHTAGVEATTGPLGQGSANAVGMAVAERFLAHRFNRPGHAIVDHHTYALVSDGDLMEGISAEAASLAGHLKLGKLVYLYDANDVSLDGPCSLTFSEEVAERYAAYGWHVQTVADGDADLDALDAAIAAARAETARPSIVIVKTTIGFGSPNKAGTSDSHGSPLGAEEVQLTKQALGWEGGDFHVPEEALAHLRTALERGAEARSAWQARFDAWAAAHPDLASEWSAVQAGDLPAGWEDAIPGFETGSKHATREAGGKVLNALAARIPTLFGGDADLGCSTKTLLSGETDFEGTGGTGRNIRYGVREHAMGAIANGIAYHGGARTYTATFFVFSDYMRPAMRLAAMNKLPVVHVFTHDSIGLGEDGPTHQPVEHLMSLRAMPNLVTIRPADAAETAVAWRLALAETGRPTSLVLSRQKLVTLDRSPGRLGEAEGTAQGAYVLRENGPPRAILIATGAEVHLALEAQDALEAQGIATRLVSMPSWELFQEQDPTYRASVLLPEVSARVSIEAGTTFGWERWIGDHGRAIGIDRYGASAPAPRLFEEFGFTVDHVVQTVRALAGAEALDRR